MNNGGQVALTGFTLQPIVAVLKSLSPAMPSWRQLTIEPEGAGDELEKVDIEWILDDGSRRHVQVKHSKNTISTSKVEEWAKALAQPSATSTTYELICFGFGHTGLEGVTEYAGVRVQILPLDHSMHMDACSHLVATFCSQQGRHVSPPAAAKTAMQLIAMLLFGARSGQPWTRAELVQHILDLTPSLAEEHRPSHSQLRVSLRRTIVVKANLGGEEYVRYEVSNPSPDPQPIRGLLITLTDPGECQTLRVIDRAGRTAQCWKHGFNAGRSKYEIWIEVGDALAPGEVVMVGAHVSRSSMLRQVGSTLVYSDPLLPTPDPQEVVLEMIFPWTVTVEGATQSSSRTAQFDLSTRNSQTDVVAMIHRDTSTVLNYDPIALSLIAKAKSDFGYNAE